jgi:ATP-binding cassette, subfamily B, bacterial
MYVLGQGIRRAPWIFALSIVGSALYGVMTTGTAWALGRVTRQVIEPSLRVGRLDPGALAGGAGLMATAALLLTIGVIVRRIAAGVVVFTLGAHFRRRVTRQYLRLPLTWHSQHPTGQLLSTANADVEATWQVFAPLPMAIGVVIMLAVAAVSMLLADLTLALIGLAVFPVLFIVNLVFQRYMSPRVTAAQQLRGEVSDVAHESFEGALVIKTMGREDAEAARFTASSYRLRDANIAVGRTRGVFDPMIEALPSLGTLAVLAVGTIRVANGQTTAATVVQVAYLFSLLGFPVRAIGWVLGELPRSVVGWDRVDAVLSAAGELPAGRRRLPASGSPAAAVGASVDLADVDYAYETGQPVLQGVQLTVEAGRTVAVVGATGSGKSTLAMLLARLADPQHGLVRLDGIALPELAVDEIARTVAFVPQQAFLFDDSIRGNITLGDPQWSDPDDAQVWQALQVAQAQSFVVALPQGLDTEVGERGTTLSGGQRQRIALARALIRQPRLLVLDDATSAVDPTVEEAILAALRPAAPQTEPQAQTPPTTVVVVASRKATIALADQVAFLAEGRIVDVGTHQQLLARQPDYLHLVDAYEREQQRARQAAADDLATA